MPLLYISEYENRNSGAPALAHHRLDVDAGGAVSGPFNEDTRLVRLHVTGGAVFVNFDDEPIPETSGIRLASDDTEYFAVKPNMKVAALEDGSVGMNTYSLDSLLQLLADPSAAKARGDALVKATAEHNDALKAVKDAQADLVHQVNALSERSKTLTKQEQDATARETQLNEREAIINKTAETNQTADSERAQFLIRREEGLNDREKELTEKATTLTTLGASITARERAVKDGEVALALAQDALAKERETLEARKARIAAA